jgi:hypothetical protein
VINVKRDYQYAAQVPTFMNLDTLLRIGEKSPERCPSTFGLLARYSVHTSAEALARREQRIAELGEHLAAACDRRTRPGEPNPSARL